MARIIHRVLIIRDDMPNDYVLLVLVTHLYSYGVLLLGLCKRGFGLDDEKYSTVKRVRKLT